MAFLFNFHSALLRSPLLRSAPHHLVRPQSQSSDRSAHAPSLGGTTSNGGWCPRPTTSCPLDSCDLTSLAMCCCCSGLRPSTAAQVFGQSAGGVMRSTETHIRIARVGLERTCDYYWHFLSLVNKKKLNLQFAAWSYGRVLPRLLLLRKSTLPGHTSGGRKAQRRQISKCPWTEKRGKVCGFGWQRLLQLSSAFSTWFSFTIFIKWYRRWTPPQRPKSGGHRRSTPGRSNSHSPSYSGTLSILTMTLSVVSALSVM